MTPNGILQQADHNEQVELLTAELELAIKWNRASAILAVYSSEPVKSHAEHAVETVLGGQGQKIIHVDLTGMTDTRFISVLDNAPAANDRILFVEGINPSSAAQSNLFIKLGMHQAIFTAKKMRIVFWVSQENAAALLRTAADFWEIRQRVFEFMEMPKPAQVLKSAIEQVWDSLDDEAHPEAIQFQMETSEADQEDSRLQLTLGILHWRKGDFPKAGIHLQQAVKDAIKVDDDLFEAECHTALALLHASQGNNAEAVQSYKQAIAVAPDHFSGWNNLGGLCLRIEKNDEAMLAFQKALKANDKDPVAWSGLGSVYSRIGYYEEAIAAYRIACESMPKLPRLWQGLGEAYALAGRDSEAAAIYQKAIELDQRSANSWLGLAKIYGKQGKSKDAVKAFQKALVIEPNCPETWNELGMVFLNSRKLEEAAKSFSKAVEIRSGFVQALGNLGMVQAGVGDHPKAIELFHKAIEAGKDAGEKASAWEKIAASYRAMNDYDQAIRAYQEADQLLGRKPRPGLKISEQNLKPEHKPPAAATEAPQAALIETTSQEQNQVHFTISSSENLYPPEEPTMSAFFSHPILKNKSKAEPRKEQAAAITFEHDEAAADSNNPAVWNEKGNIHFRNGAYNEAIAAYNRSIELDRSFGWPYSNLALTYLTLGKFSEAILLYQKSIVLLKTNEEKAASWNSLGNIYRQLNNYEDALNAYQNADEVDPHNAGRRDRAEFAYSDANTQNAQVWLELGNLFFKAASYSEAVKAYTKAIQIDPSSGWAHSNLAMSLVFQGRHRDAVPVYLKSIELFTNSRDKAVSWNRLGNVYRRLNELENARKAYENGAKLSDEKTSLLTRTRFSLLGNCYTN